MFILMPGKHRFSGGNLNVYFPTTLSPQCQMCTINTTAHRLKRTPNLAFDKQPFQQDKVAICQNKVRNRTCHDRFLKTGCSLLELADTITPVWMNRTFQPSDYLGPSWSFIMHSKHALWLYVLLHFLSVCLTVHSCVKCDASFHFKHSCKPITFHW